MTKKKMYFQPPDAYGIYGLDEARGDRRVAGGNTLVKVRWGYRTNDPPHTTARYAAMFTILEKDHVTKP